MNDVLLEKAEFLRKYLVERPGLKLEMASYLDLGAERALLKERVLDFRLANAGRSATGFDQLWQELDRGLIDAATVEAYALWLEAAALESVSSAPVGEEAPTALAPAPVSAEKEPKEGLVRRMKRFFRLPVADLDREESRRVDTAPAVTADASGEEPTAEAPGELAPPTLEEMRGTLLAEIGDDQIPVAWLEEIRRRRIHAMKEEILKDGSVEASRVFQKEVSLESGEGRSELRFNLTD